MKNLGFIKEVLVVSILFICCSFAFASDYDSDPRTAAMGGIGTTGLGSDMTFFSNPAAIKYYNQAKKFIIQTEFANYQTKGNSVPLEQPSFNFKGQFVGKGVALTIGCESFLGTYETDAQGNRLCYGFRQFDFAVSAAYRFRGLSVGGSIYGGSLLERSGIEISSSRPLWDIISKAFFTHHVRMQNSEFVKIRFGIMYNFRRFTLSAKTNELLSYYGMQNNLSFDNALRQVDFGVYYDSERFGRRGRLNSWVFSAGIETTEFFTLNRKIRGGLEVTCQLAKSYSISLRAGYASFPNKLESGDITSGLGIRAGKFDLSAYDIIPVSIFKGDGGSYKIGINFTVLM